MIATTTAPTGVVFVTVPEGLDGWSALKAIRAEFGSHYVANWLIIENGQPTEHPALWHGVIVLVPRAKPVEGERRPFGRRGEAMVLAEARIGLEVIDWREEERKVFPDGLTRISK